MTVGPPPVYAYGTPQMFLRSPASSLAISYKSARDRISTAAKILMTTGSNSGSHFSVLAKVATALVERGHTVTALISDAYADKAKESKYAEFKFDIFHESDIDLSRQWPAMYANYLISKKVSFFANLFKWKPPAVTSLLRNCKDMIDHFVGKTVQYDLFMLDGHSPCSVFLAGRLNIPYVILIPSGIKPSLARRHGIPDTSTYYPEMSTGLSHRMGFFQRVSNTITAFCEDAVVFFEYDMLSFILSFQFNVETPIRTLLADAQLVLVNSDFAVDFPFPLQPNVVTVGGLTTRPSQPLTPDWEELVRSAGKDGVVLFTLGTYSASILTLETMEKFVRAFAALPQLVVWQMQDEPPASLQLSDNIRIVSWMPQNDLLGHSSLKALVFHGGNNGMYEALYHGVPMVVMPLIYDHPDVAARVVDRGMGVVVDFFSFTIVDLTVAIHQVITDPRYRENTQRVSAIFKAHPQPPLERAAFWIEHVLKYGGDYLRSSRTDLYIWQVYSLDVYAFLLLLVYLSYRVLKFCLVRRYHRGLLAAIFACLKIPLRCICPLRLRKVIGNHISWPVARGLRKRSSSSTDNIKV
ncbi:UDP-glucuronosyltransferase 2C1-like [Diadema setosum]|uniref:UDP-glucuronosyltransferase 2C1-like n=1 Tax=Diadema setosum TaxID=31175 RepID=UPI003B3B3729